MSRNVRIKYPRPPAQVAKRRGSAHVAKRRGSDSSSSLQLSDDDGYSGVEDIDRSDEDDEDHVNVAEEEHLTGGRTSPRPQDHFESDADEAEVGAEDEDEESRQFMDEDNVSLAGNAGPTEVEATKARVSQESEMATPRESAGGERRVRFTGVPDSDTDSTTSDAEDDRSFFPDIFVEQSNLDAAFRREIEQEDDVSSDENFWEFHYLQNPWDEANQDYIPNVPLEDNTPMATPAGSTAPTLAPSPTAIVNLQELDGYETDGDTTEEDIPVPIVRKKQIRRPLPVVASSGSDTERPTRLKRGQPRLGRYNLDDSEKKPIAVLNPMTRKMMIFTPQKRHHDLSPECFDLDFSAHAGLLASSPITSNQASLMINNTMVSSNTFGDIMNGQPFGPAGAFLPFMPDPLATLDSDSSNVEDAEDDEEKKLNLFDFITFNPRDSGDDDDHEHEEDESGPGCKDGEGDDAMTTPSRPNTALNTAPSTAHSASVRSDTSTVHPLLSHFGSNSDTVGAFRRSQINQQLILSNKASQDSLAFSGPLHYGTLRGIRSGSMKTITTPITPARRRKPSKSGTTRDKDPSSVDPFEDLESSPSIFMSRKRNASSELEVPSKKMKLLDDDFLSW